jgi:uncharacterized membrane protein YbhN (UPF0104 family)
VAGRSGLIWLLKLAVSAALLAFVLRRAPLADIADSLGHADLRWFAAALGLTAVIQGLAAHQVAVLFRAIGASLSTRRILRINLGTDFYALFLPGYLAGGVLRWYKLTKAGSPPMDTLAVVVVNRLLETTVLVAFAGLFWWMEPLPGAPESGRIALILAGGGLLLAHLVVLDRRLARSFGRLVAPREGSRHLLAVRRRLAELAAALEGLGGIPVGIAVRVLLLALLRNVISVFMFHCLALSLDLPVSIANTGFARSVILLLMLLPITVAGLGLREGGFFYVLSRFGAASGGAVAMSFLLLANDLAVKLVGGALELKDWLRRRGAQEDAR